MKVQVLSKLGAVAIIGAALVTGISALSGTPAIARPDPECGPTRQWVCIYPPCLSCPPVYFTGTICEMNAYQKQTGRTCSPIGG
jgi:hypothetical protein